MNGHEGLALARDLIDHGIPVIVGTPNPNWTPGNSDDVLPLKAWSTVTAADCDLSSFRPGIDTLAMVCGHGVDVVDVDSKVGASLDDLPIFARYGMTRTPSQGWHLFVPSTGVGKGTLYVAGKTVGDYCGGKPDGKGRALAYLPGSTRPKYPALGYTIAEPIDLDALLDSPPDDELLAMLAVSKPAAPTAAEVYATIADYTGPIPIGQRHRLLLSYAGHLRNLGNTRDEAKLLMSRRWRDCQQVTGNKFTIEQAVALVDDVFDRYTGPGTPDDQFDRDVAREVHRLRVSEAARAVVRADGTATSPPLDVALLDDIDDEPTLYRIDGLVPIDGNALVVAKRKTGKTTLLHNITRALRTGEPFLGCHEVERIGGRVGFLNYELPRGMFRRWAKEAGLTSDDLLTVNLRGRRNPLAHDDDLATLRDALIDHDVEIIMVDPISRAFVGDNINDTGQMTQFLAALDVLKTEVGASNLIVAAHAGWNNDRARNSSVMEDWADSIVTLTSNEAGDRFISAIGRDVDLDEDRLNYDLTTRKLTLTGAGGRKAAAADSHLKAIMDAIVHAVCDEPGLTVTALEERLRDSGVGLQKGDVSRAAKAAEGAGRLRRAKVGRVVQHHPADYTDNKPQHAPTPPDGARDIPRPALHRAGYVEGTSLTTPPGHADAVNTVMDLLGGEVVA